LYIDILYPFKLLQEFKYTNESYGIAYDEKNVKENLQKRGSEKI